MNTTSYDIEDHHLELLIPIVGSGCTVLTLFLKGIISKLFPKVNVNDGGGDGGGGGVGPGAGNTSINHQQEDADVVLDKLCEPPGIMDQYRYTQIIGDKGEISLRLPPGLTEEIVAQVFLPNQMFQQILHLHHDLLRHYQGLKLIQQLVQFHELNLSLLSS